MKFPLGYGDGHNEEGLGCPVCGFDGGVHIDQVQVAARREDASPLSIYVDAVSGHIERGSSRKVPTGRMVGEGRRHRIALLGTCELGHEFAIVFTQHKGATYVEVMAPEWRPLGGAK